MKASAMVAALMDATAARIGELAADGRYFDRSQVAGLADLWDNNTFAAFECLVTRRPWVRERRARAVLRALAGRNSSRREWMVAVAGDRLAEILGPVGSTPLAYRDYRDLVVPPGRVPLTAEALDGIARDYDLGAARVRHAVVERAGARLWGALTVLTPRRYSAPEESTEAEVQFFLDDVRDSRFDSDDVRGAAVTLTPAGVDIRLGDGGHLGAASAEVDFEDRAWHLSAAGRAADAVIPPLRRPGARPRPERRSLGAAGEPSLAFREAMLRVRSVRYAKLVGRVPLREWSLALRDAGSRVRVAAALHGTSRDAAFARLTADWSGVTEPERSTGTPELAQLTHVRHRAGDVVLNLAIPDGAGGWGLWSAEYSGVPHVAWELSAFLEARAVRHDGAELSLGGTGLRLAAGATA